MTANPLLETNLCLIGGGNMATALIQGLIQSGIKGNRIRVSEPDPVRAQALTASGVILSADNLHAVKDSSLVVIAVKPGVVPSVLAEITPHLHPSALVVSIAAGITLDNLQQRLPPGQPVIRSMPNTPALVGEGVTVLCPGTHVTAPQLHLAETLLGTVGDVRTVMDESLIDGVTALSGSGPAYVYLILEALSDGGVACGLPRDLATWLAINTVKGSAALVQETGQHPGVLKNQVTSPGGTTIAALQVLEEAGIRGTLMRAVTAAWQRSRELGRKS
ncbi:MAG: pyrroline-5-carboxylate reductase [Magnetococcales bacterium]|nr:pyrroline-5-carboxylate reductase [Magnetococcales bacterium]